MMIEHLLVALSPQLMRRIWGKGSHVQCLHPMTPCLAGHDDVSTSLLSKEYDSIIILA